MKFKQVVAGATAGVLLSGVAFSLMGAGVRSISQTVNNDYNASKMFVNDTSGITFKDPDKQNDQLNDFMSKHPGGVVTVSVGKLYTVFQYSYHK